MAGGNGPLRIGHFISAGKPGGAESYVRRLAEHQRAAGHDVTVICNPGGTWQFSSRGIPVRALWRLNRYDPTAPWRLARLVRPLRLDLLTVHLISASFVGGLARGRMGIPVVATSHGLDRRSGRWVYRPADRVIAVSCAVKDHLVRQGVPPEKITVIRNGIEVERFVPRMSKRDARARLGLPADAVVVGSAGHLVARKGFDDLLRAWREVIRDHPEAHLAIAGDGRYRGRFERLAARLGASDRVTFLGYQKDMPLFIWALDLYAQPSRSEGLPLTVLETMAAGVPAVATDVGGTREAIIEGETGILVRARDPGALGRGIGELAGDPARRARLGEAARCRAFEHFREERAVAAVEAVYREVLGVRA